MTALRINVAGLLKETAGAARDYDVDAAPAELAELLEDARPGAPLRGRLRLLRTPRSIFVRGRLTTDVVVDCSRCLVEVDTPLTLDLDTEYFPEVDISTGHPLEVPDDDLAFTIDPNHELDLREMVRQDILLQIPMHPLCAETCRGLCPECGANLNEGSCEHEGHDVDAGPAVVDERLAALARLLQPSRDA